MVPLVDSPQRKVGLDLRRGFVIIAGFLFLLACESCTHKGDSPPTLDTLVPDELWQAANHGRIPLREDGFFAFPSRAERVFVDVGAYKLKESRPSLRKSPKNAVLAVEPMRETWDLWPDNRRLVGVPVAVSLEPGTIEFNVNAKDVTSSVLDTAEGGRLSSDTIEVRRVPSVRLEDLLRRIPPHLDIFFLKTDTQGLDLAVLMSAGNELRRVRRVSAEIVFDPSYEGRGPGEMSTEEEFDAYMRGKGFVRIPSKADEFLRSNKLYLDAVYERIEEPEAKARQQSSR